MKFLENSTAQAFASLFWMIAGCDINADPDPRDDLASSAPETNGDKQACDGTDRYVYDDCNGTDDDCDGEVDENEPGLEVCNDSSCTTGQPFCENGIWSDCGALPELCNGVDDNCDRVIDEGCPCEGAPEGDIRDCGSPWIGECVPGIQLCLHGQWTECVGGTWPKDETCDGRDNDCDDEIDEDWPLLGMPCDGDDDDFCEEGSYVCLIDPKGFGSGMVCYDASSDNEEVCNGADDDCDGEVDEGLLNACGTCGPTPAESCDGSDNDCDGEVDEGSNACGGVCTLAATPGTLCDGPDTDLCMDDAYECMELNSIVCSTGTTNVETCNGADDDCDGTVDEGSNPCGGVCTLALTPCANCCDGPDGDLCNDDSRVCSGLNATTCSTGTTNVETCNGADDDCDGTTDEGSNPCGGVCTLSGTPGAPCDGTDTDLCDEGIYSCASLNSLLCSDTTSGANEVCNGADDDCNGTVDEGSNPCGGVCTLSGTPGAPCDGPDDDLCREGAWGCAGLNSVTCSDTTDTTVETCNGADDDCDSAVDEDLVRSCGSENCAGVTTCSGGAWSACSSDGVDCGVCCLCVSSANPAPRYDSTQNADCSPTECPSAGCGGVCGANTYTNYSARENYCNSLHTCTNYACNPACEGDGDGDGYSPSCGDCNDANRYARPGLFELCDQIDNNCDGAVDEGCDTPLAVLDAPFAPASGAVRGVFDASVSGSGRVGLGGVDSASGLRHHLIKFYWSLSSGERIANGSPSIASFLNEVRSSGRMPVLAIDGATFVENTAGLGATAQERAREFAYWLRDSYDGESAVELFPEMNLNPSPYCPGGWSASTCVAVFRRAFQFVSNMLLRAAPSKAHLGIGYNMRWLAGSGGGPGTRYTDWDVDRVYYSWVGYHIFAHACITGGARETADPWFLMAALTEPGNDFQATFCADTPCLIAETGASDQCSTGYQNWWIDRFAIGSNAGLPYFNVHLPDIRGYIWFHQNNAARGGWEEDWRIADFGHYGAIFGDPYFRDAP